MPYKTGKLKGQLTTAEIRKLIRGHNILTSIKIPKGADRDDIIKIIENKGYSVNHEKKSLDPKGGISKGRPKVKLQKAQELTKPKPKTELQKQKASESKAQKEAKRKKEEREIRKKAVQEEKARSKPKPKPKTTTIETQTEKPKPKKEPKKQPLAIEDKSKEKKPELSDSEIKKMLTEKLSPLNGNFTKLKQFPGQFHTRIILTEKYKPDEEIKEIKSKLSKELLDKLIITFNSPGNNKRTKMINQLSQEIGKKFNPFKILGITASQETPELVKSRCRELRLKEHPDKGGSKEKFDLIQKACKILLDTQKIN
jgi:hypothetical protein